MRTFLLAAGLGLASFAAAQPVYDLTDAAMVNWLPRQDAGASNASSNVGNTTCATSNGIDPASVQPALYTEAYRPQVHFSPSTGFMNDPNGLVRSGDTWHMYYQYNPNDTVAGFQHWGHATSKDLYAWQNHPPSIAPVNKTEGIFSGSAILDVNNTSGFFNDSTPADSRFVAIYTLNTATSQTQNIAYSRDGQTYTKYSGNPVISLNTTQFRDPKVFYDDAQSHWVMTVSHPQTYQVIFYSSTDLKTWQELSRFGPYGVLGFQYECPDLVKVQVQGGPRDGQSAWVLIVSINPGAPLGGSFVQNFIGEWNGTAFQPWSNDIGGAVQITDFAKDYYAVQTFYNAPGNDTVLIGWASNWQYTNFVPTSPYRSQMTIPRQLFVRYVDATPMQKGYLLTQEPYNFDALQKTSLTSNTSTTGGNISNTTVALNGDGAFSIKLNVTMPPNITGIATPRIDTRISTDNDGEYLTVGLLFGIGGDPCTVFIDRRFAGQAWGNTNPFFTDRFSGQFQPFTSADGQQQITLQVIVDRTITEVFAQNGVSVGTVTHFWDNDAKPSSFSLGISNSTAVSVTGLQVDAIPSTWATCP